MTEGYVSDIIGDDTVMDEPEATLSIDISQLEPAQALQIARAAGLDQQDDLTVGQLVQGKEIDDDYIQDAEFHIPIEAAVTALEELQIIGSNTAEVEAEVNDGDEQ